MLGFWVSTSGDLSASQLSEASMPIRAGAVRRAAGHGLMAGLGVWMGSIVSMIPPQKGPRQVPACFAPMVPLPSSAPGS
jgi:hypothetical protein